MGGPGSGSKHLGLFVLDAHDCLLRTPSRHIEAHALDEAASFLPQRIFVLFCRGLGLFALALFCLVFGSHVWRRNKALCSENSTNQQDIRRSSLTPRMAKKYEEFTPGATQ